MELLERTALRAVVAGAGDLATALALRATQAIFTGLVILLLLRADVLGVGTTGTVTAVAIMGIAFAALAPPIGDLIYRLAVRLAGGRALAPLLLTSVAVLIVGDTVLTSVA